MPKTKRRAAQQPAQRLILDALAARGTGSRYWLANHKENPLTPNSTYLFLRGETTPTASNWLKLADIVGLEVRAKV